MVAFSPLPAASADAAGPGGLTSIGTKIRWLDMSGLGRVSLWRCKPSGAMGLRPRRRRRPNTFASMLESLARVAGSAGMPFLVYLMALEEAKENATRD